MNGNKGTKLSLLPLFDRNRDNGLSLKKVLVIDCSNKIIEKLNLKQSLC